MQQLLAVHNNADDVTRLELISGRGSGVKLKPRFVYKPWGRRQLPEIFAITSGLPTGEVWFSNGDDLPLLAKYLFTSQALSVQVHPDDEQARARGLPMGKMECWYILDAEPGAVIGLGLRHEVLPDVLRQAASDGSIEHLIDWRPVAAGDFFLVPPGTVHAIGAGISLLELQQNSDVTYRLYDYGRPRELHLNDGIAVSRCGPYPDSLHQRVNPSVDAILVDGPRFTLLHVQGDALTDRQRWVLPIEGFARAGSEVAHPGECLLLRPNQFLDEVEGRLMIAAAPISYERQLEVA